MCGLATAQCCSRQGGYWSLVCLDGDQLENLSSSSYKDMRNSMRLTWYCLWIEQSKQVRWSGPGVHKEETGGLSYGSKPEY